MDVPFKCEVVEAIRKTSSQDTPEQIAQRTKQALAEARPFHHYLIRMPMLPASPGLLLVNCSQRVDATLPWQYLQTFCIFVS